MARGSSKSDVDYRDPQDRAEEFSKQGITEYNKQLQTVATRMLDDVLGNYEARAWFEELLIPVSKYQGDRHFEFQGHKERRERIAASFEGLPQYVKDFLGMPKSVISVLYRGADHPANPGPDGTINASFSGNPGWAKTFSDGKVRHQGGHKKYEDANPRLYTKDDIESFGNIISLQRVMDLVGQMKVRLEEKHGTEPQERDVAQMRSSLDFAGSRLTRRQAEYIVTNIKWKAGTT